MPRKVLTKEESKAYRQGLTRGKQLMLDRIENIEYRGAFTRADWAYLQKYAGKKEVQNV